MASLEGEAPIKQCVIILEKKVRNLEKRKVKLDSYKNKAKEGVLLDKDQQEAVSKYDQVVQNLEFSKELLKQFQQINNETEKVLRKQAKRDKIEKQNSDISRLKEILKCQVALKTLSDSEAREGFISGKCSALNEDQLKILDDFHNLVTISKDLEQSYGQQCNGAAEHLYLLFEKSEKTVLGEVTYKDVAQLMDSITAGCYFEAGLPQENIEAKEKRPVKDTISLERAIDDEPQQLLNGNNAVETVCIASNGFEASEVLPEVSTTLHAEVSEAPVVENGTPYQNSEGVHSQQLQQTINRPASELQSTVVDHQAPTVPQGVMMGGHWPCSEPLVQSQLVNSFPYDAPLAAQYFGTSTFDGQRPLIDIVSSMQGSYNFLQESLIEGAENQNNVNNSSIVNAPADVVVSSTSPSSSLQPQIIDHHQHLQQDQHQLPMATIAGSQAGGYPVYHSRLHPPHLLHHHHEGQTLGMSTSVPSDVYFPQQQLYQRIPSNVYERNNQTIPDVMEVNQHQQIPSNISTPSPIVYPPYVPMKLPDSETECQISGFMMGSVPNVSVYQQQQQQQPQQQQLENQKGSYTMNPNADIFHSGFHATSQTDGGLVNEVPVEQPQNGSSGQSDESKDVGSKTFAQTASAGKSYQEFTNTQNQRGPKPVSQYQRHPNRQQFVNRQGNVPPYNNNSNPTRGGNVSYRGGAKYGGPGGARPPSQGNSFYQRNEHYHS